MSDPLNVSPPANPAFVLDVAQLVVTSLNLDVTAADIDPDAPLYGGELGLDSIDILEIALAVSKQYGVQLRADDADNLHIFSSLHHLAKHVAALRRA